MVKISGIGLIGACGRGLNSLEALLLKRKTLEAELIDVHGLDSKIPVYPINKEDLKDKALSRKMRRADRFSKMAVIAAADALNDSGFIINSDNCTSIGIVLSTGFGPHLTTFDFLDGYLDYGETAVSPTSFSHSVHNAAASYISGLLGIRGPTQTVTDFEISFQNAFLIAESWIREGRCDHVLLGSVDELGEQMEYVLSRLYSQKELIAKKFNSSIISGEGAAFFLLSRDKVNNSYCEITSASHCSRNVEETVDIQILDSTLIREKTDENSNSAIKKNVFSCIDYRHLLGNIKIMTAFNVAIGALMLKKQCFYLPQNKDNNSKNKQNLIKTVSCSKFFSADKAILEFYLKIN